MQFTDFKKSFECIWKEEIQEPDRRSEVLNAYARDGSWTRFMLGDSVEMGLLSKIAATQGLTMVREYEYLDCVYYREGVDLLKIFPHGGYPAGYDVIVEHENGRKPEEEWWKLLNWRAPLKVLIFYDHSGSGTQEWLTDKFESFSYMAQKAQQCWEGRRDEDEYLLIVGDIQTGGEPPGWRWFVMRREKDYRILEIECSDSNYREAAQA